MSKVAGVIQFKAKPGLGDELAQCIAKAKPHVEAEPGTLSWFVLRSDSEPDTVFVVDVFADDSSLNAHMKGAAARQILASVPTYLCEELKVHPSTIVSAKGA